MPAISCAHKSYKVKTIVFWKNWGSGRLSKLLKLLRGGQAGFEPRQPDTITGDHCLKRMPKGSDSKDSTCNAGDVGSIPELGRSPGEGQNPLQCSCLENPNGQRSLAGYSPWDHKESDMNERLNTAQKSETGADNLKRFSPRDSRHWNPICTKLCVFQTKPKTWSINSSLASLFLKEHRLNVVRKSASSIFYCLFPICQVLPHKSVHLRIIASKTGIILST